MFLEKLEKLEKEYLEIQVELASPEIVNDHVQYTALSRRYKTLELLQIWQKDIVKQCSQKKRRKIF